MSSWSKVFLLFSGFAAFSCQSMQNTFSSLIDANATRPQKTVLHPIVSKSVFRKLNEGPRKVNRMTPIFAGDQVIVGSGNSGVASVSLYGQTNWESAIKNGVEASSLLIGKTLFVPADDGFIYKIDSATGKTIDSVRTGAENLSDLSSSPDQKTIYAHNSTGTIFAINAENLKINWSYSRVDTSPSTVRGTSKVVWAQNKVFVGLSDGNLISLDAATGTVVWEKSLNRNKKFRDIDATPVISNGRIYVSAYDEKTYCLDLNGQILWQAAFGGFAAPALLDGTLYVPTSTNQVVALDIANGGLKWAFDTKGVPTEIKFIKGYGVFGSSQGPLYLVDIRNGKEVSHFEPGRGIFSAPSVKPEGDLVAFVSGEAVLYIVQVQRQMKE